ncbi:hypothetical protein Salat_2554300 [Sesamum alatum]|uniref:Pentatricopeptide repeat-containing protein n=1 Tax=Sesamum alatum TaxID=300844 RepID=A0AAE2CCQ7_9LAMI|nr:hypothetical protein Salat_2554300 [Sesamum alatum]
MAPTVVTYCSLINGLCRLGYVKEAIYYFNRMKNADLQPNVVVYTSLIHGLCKNDCIEDARRLFLEMPEKGLIPDKIAYTSLIDGTMKQGNIQEALDLARVMTETGVEFDLHAYTCLISGLCRCGQLQQARDLLYEMIKKGVQPDEIVYGCLIRKYHELGNREEADVLLNEMMERGNAPIKRELLDRIYEPEIAVSEQGCRSNVGAWKTPDKREHYPLMRDAMGKGLSESLVVQKLVEYTLGCLLLCFLWFAKPACLRTSAGFTSLALKKFDVGFGSGCSNLLPLGWLHLRLVANANEGQIVYHLCCW